jgi:hypothetical protein
MQAVANSSGAVRAIQVRKATRREILGLAWSSFTVRAPQAVRWSSLD